MTLIRTVVEQEDSFDGALKRLEQTPLVSSIYYIIEGVQTNQGAVIERDRNGVHKTIYLSDQQWFYVQTNTDSDKPDPDGRRDIAT